jgi:transcriptional antiterminator RfaH
MFTKVIRRRDNNKPRKSVLPLFPGYICFAAPSGFERDVFRTGRVVSIIEVRHQRRFVNELEQIYASLAANAPLQPCYDLVPGEEAVVISGPLRGIRGTVVKMQSESKLILSVDGLGRAAMVIDAYMVKPVEKR